MISVFLSVVCIGSSTTNIVERTTVGRNVWTGKLYLDTHSSVTTEFDFFSNTSYLPKFHVKALPVDLYTFRMTNNVEVNENSTVLANTHYMQLSPWSLSEFSLILNLYETDFFYLGRPPREIKVHLKDTRCQDQPVEHLDTQNKSSPAYYAAKVTMAGQPVGLSYANNRHHIQNKSLCHWQTIVLPENNETFLHVYIDCSDFVESSENVFAASLLNIGLYSGVNEMCLYTPNNYELDHEFGITLVGFLFVFLCIWIEWTRERPPDNNGLKGYSNVTREGPPGEANDRDYDRGWTEDDVWKVTTVTYAPLVYQVIILVISTSIYARSQKSHNIYNFATMRMVDKNVVDITAIIFSWVVCPIIGSLALFVMAVGKILYDKSEQSVFCGWGIEVIEKKPPSFRYAFTFFVFCLVYGMLYVLWVEGLQDWLGSIAIGVTLLPTFIHFSNPHWLSSYLLENG